MAEEEGKHEDDLPPDFHFNHQGLTSAQAEEQLRKFGPNILPEKVIPKWKIFCSQLYQPMPLMIWAAAAVEAGIQSWPDMAILLFILFANASISYYETTKAGDAIAELKRSLKPKATVKRDGKWADIDAAGVVPDDCVQLLAGAAVPADCRLNEGELDLDQSSLTGESLPVAKFRGSVCLMGSTVARGESEATVELTGANTFFGKTASLLQQKNELSNLQKTIMRIMWFLVVLSVTLCTITLIYLLVGRAAAFVDALSFVVVLLVASIPLAIEIVTTTTLSVGSKEMAKEGAIVARLAAIEDLASCGILCSDKTGTLTMNKMVLQDETPMYMAGETQHSLLRFAAMAAKWRDVPRDALDTLVLNAVDKPSLEHVEQLNYVPFDPRTKRTEGTLRDPTSGKTFKTTKGAPHILLKLLKDQKTHDLVVADVARLGARGIRCLAVCRTSGDVPEDDWMMIGLLTFLDPPRHDTKATIERALQGGVAVKMVTGDHLLIAKETARALNLGTNILPPDNLPLLDPVTKLKPPNLGRDYGEMCLAADGFAQVFPEHKYLIVEALRELGFKVGMTGDGVNDAPALKRADVGIAVSGATSAACAAAAVVLTRDGLSTIISGLYISRKVFARIRNFLMYRCAATLQLVLFFFCSVFLFSPPDYKPAGLNDTWPDFFHMPILMLMLITLLNDGTLIAIGYDRVEPAKHPEKWNLRALLFIGFVLAFVAMISSELLLWCLLDSWNSTGFFQKSGLGGLTYGQVTTAIYLKVSVSDFLTLFSARTGPNPFYTTAPSRMLLGAASVALTTSTILACAWPQSTPDNLEALGLGRATPYSLAPWIWLYCVIWWFIQDACKCYAWRALRRYNVFGINDDGAFVGHEPETFARIAAQLHPNGGGPNNLAMTPLKESTPLSVVVVANTDGHHPDSPTPPSPGTKEQARISSFWRSPSRMGKWAGRRDQPAAPTPDRTIP